MILAFMQPYFFPYLSYFELISRADKFIFFDTAQYMKGGWVNRNRILKSAVDWQYLTVPIKRQSLSTQIRDTRMSTTMDWRADLRCRLSYYKDRAPNYDQVYCLFSNCLEYDGASISELNIYCIERVCAYIGIQFEYEAFSDIGVTLGPIRQASDWALQLSKALSAREYVNLPGGREFYDKREFDKEGIKLKFLNCPDLEYDCAGFPSIPGLSILDVLMWLPASQVCEYLHRRLEG